MKAQNVHNSTAEIEEFQTQALPKVDTNLKISELPIPWFLEATTKAKTFGEYVRFNMAGDTCVSVTFNAMPVKEGVITPSIYARRVHTVWAAFQVFLGEIVSASRAEVIYNRNGADVMEKAAYKWQHTQQGNAWVEYRYRFNEYHQTRVGFPPTFKVRTPGIRLPLSVITVLEAAGELLPTGQSIEVGLQTEPNLANWMHDLFTEGRTVEQYTAERLASFAASAANKAAYKAATRSSQDANPDETFIWLSNKPGEEAQKIMLSLVPDGRYIVMAVGAAPRTIKLDSSSTTSINLWAQHNAAGAKFSKM